MVSQVSTALVVNEKKLLMVFDEEESAWNTPSLSRKKGELSAEAAERALETHTGCTSETVRYRKKYKTTVTKGENEVTVQSFEIEITEEPENGEWVHVSELDSKKLAPSLEKVKGTIKDKL